MKFGNWGGKLMVAAVSIHMVSASSDLYFLENGKIIQSCAYISTADKWYERMFKGPYPGMGVYPYVDGLHYTANHEWVMSNNPQTKECSEEELAQGCDPRRLDEKETRRREVNIYVLQMSADDYRKVDLGSEPAVRICDDMAVDAGLCDEPSSEEKSARRSLVEIIDTHSFSSPIHSIMTNLWGERIFYDVPTSGLYCTILHTNEIPEDIEEFAVLVDWIQGYGGLLIPEFKRMYLAFLLTVAYGVYSLVYLGITFWHIHSDRTTAFSIDSLKNTRFIFQYKIISFSVGMFFVQLMTMLDYIFANAFGHTQIFVTWFYKTLELIANTLLIVWVVYNLVLFSAGAWVLQAERSNLKFTIAKYASLGLLVQLFFHDFASESIFSLFDEGAHDIFSWFIVFQLVITLAICLVWSFKTTYEIEDVKIRWLYLKTIAIVGSVFSATLMYRIFDDSIRGAHFAALSEVIAFVAFSLIWHRVFYESGKLVL